MPLEELKANTWYPDEEGFKKGSVVVMEYIRNIPCNTCEAECRFLSINIEKPITNLSEIEGLKCVGCCMCIAYCSDHFIFVLDKTWSDNRGTVTMPWEYYPMPKEGSTFHGVNRSGDVVCDDEIIKVRDVLAFDRTLAITVTFPMDMVDEMHRIQRREKEAEQIVKDFNNGKELDGNTLVWLCEEVTLGEIKKAIPDGACYVTGINRRIRAGMGLCQGPTCEKMVQAIILQELGNKSEEISTLTCRRPVRPTTFGSIAVVDPSDTTGK